jgi:hypothetical protein
MAHLVPLLSKLSFFQERKAVSSEDIGLIGCNMNYLRYEAGQTVYNQDDENDHRLFLILKGRVQISVADPLTDSSRRLAKQAKEEEDQSEDRVDELHKEERILSLEEIRKLPQIEQKRYRTKMILSEILNSGNPVRLTNSPGQMLREATEINSKIKLGVPRLGSPKKLMISQQSPKGISHLDSPKSNLDGNSNAFITGVELGGSPIRQRLSTDHRSEVQ